MDTQIKDQLDQTVLELLQYGSRTTKTVATKKKVEIKSPEGALIETIESEQTVSTVERKPISASLLIYLSKTFDLNVAIALLKQKGFDVAIKDPDLIRKWLEAQDLGLSTATSDSGFSDETIEALKARVLELDV